LRDYKPQLVNRHPTKQHCVIYRFRALHIFAMIPSDRWRPLDSAGMK